MPRPSLLIVVGSAALLAWHGTLEEAHASDCLDVSVGPAEEPDVVFVGTVQRTEQVTQPQPAGEPTFEGTLANQPRQRITFRIDEASKGIDAPAITLDLPQDGCTSRLTSGERWRVHARRDPQAETGYRVLEVLRQQDAAPAAAKPQPAQRSHGCAGCAANAADSGFGATLLVMFSVIAARRKARPRRSEGTNAP